MSQVFLSVYPGVLNVCQHPIQVYSNHTLTLIYLCLQKADMHSILLQSTHLLKC